MGKRPADRTACAVAALLAILSVALPSRVPAAEGDGDPAEREWSQWQGNSSRTGIVASRPVRSEPVEVWRKEVGRLRSNIVCWGGTLYYLAGERAVHLHAIRIATGEEHGTPQFLSSGGSEISVWEGTVVVWSLDLLRGHPHFGTGFGSGWSKKVFLSAAPVLHRGVLYGSSGDRLRSFDVRTGKELDGMGEFAASGHLAVGEESGGPAAATLVVGARSQIYADAPGTYACLLRARIANPAAGTFGGAMAPASASELAASETARIDVRRVRGNPSAGLGGGWLITPDIGLRTTDGKFAPRCVVPDGMKLG